MSYQTYVYGNTVRKINTMPEMPYEAAPKKRVSKQTRKAREKAFAMNIGYAMFFTAIMSLLLFGCIKYLQIQASVTSSMKHINAMESQISDLRADNDAEYNRVMMTENLEEIRRIAIEELGMVYASESQVVLFTGKDTDFVRQYEDVPTSTGDIEIQSKAASLFGR